MSLFHWPAICLGRLALFLMPILFVSAEIGMAESPPLQPFQEGQIVDVRTGQAIPFEDLLAILADQDVVYVGEEHQNRRHVDAAVRILEGLLARQRQPVLALEMFSWDGQEGIDRYLSGHEVSRADFLRESHWELNWGGAFENYEPLVLLARNRRVPVLALNPPRSLVRLVAGKGMTTALTETDMERWGMRDEAFPEDAAYRDMIVKPLRQCHGGLSDQDYQRMYEASVFRDEGMAKVIAENLRRMRAQAAQSESGPDGGARPGPILSYTGAGHIQYYLPVPNRVLRRVGSPVKQISIYLTAFDPARSQEIHDYLRDHIADYVWLTPLGAHGTPRRCK